MARALAASRVTSATGRSTTETEASTPCRFHAQEQAVLDAARQKEPFPGITWRPGQVQASSGPPLCGKLQDVTLVMMAPRAERILSLLGYADWLALCFSSSRTTTASAPFAGAPLPM